MPLPVFYKTAEVAAAMKVSVDTVRDLVARTAEVNPMRLSDSPFAEMRFTEEDVAALVKAHKPVPASTERKRRRRRPAA